MENNVRIGVSIEEQQKQQNFFSKVTDGFKKVSAQTRKYSDEADRANKRLEKMEKQSTGVTNALSGVSSSLSSFKNSSQGLNNAVHQFSLLDTWANRAKDTLFGTSQAYSQMQVQLGQYGEFLVRSMAARLAGMWALLRVMRQTTQTVYDMDSIRRGIQRMTGSFDESSEAIKYAIGISHQYGNSIKEVTAALTELYRQGRSTTDVKRLLTGFADVQALMVTSTGKKMKMDEIMSASTAVMEQMNLTVSQTIDALKRMSVMDAKTAASFNNIAYAIKRSGAAANVAGAEYSELIDAATALAEARISPERIGTSLRTMYERSTRPETQKWLRNVGVDMYKEMEDGSYKVLNVVELMAEAYKKTGENIQSLTQFSGKRYVQEASVLAMLQQQGRLAEYQKLMAEENNKSAEERRKQIEMMTGSLANFQERMRTAFSAIFIGEDTVSVVREGLKATEHIAISLGTTLKEVVGSVLAIAGGIRSSTDELSAMERGVVRITSGLGVMVNIFAAGIVSKLVLAGILKTFEAIVGAAVKLSGMVGMATMSFEEMNQALEKSLTYSKNYDNLSRSINKISRSAMESTDQFTRMQQKMDAMTKAVGGKQVFGQKNIAATLNESKLHMVNMVKMAGRFKSETRSISANMQEFARSVGTGSAAMAGFVGGTDALKVYGGVNTNLSKETARELDRLKKASRGLETQFKGALGAFNTATAGLQSNLKGINQHMLPMKDSLQAIYDMDLSKGGSLDLYKMLNVPMLRDADGNLKSLEESMRKFNQENLKTQNLKSTWDMLDNRTKKLNTSLASLSKKSPDLARTEGFMQLRRNIGQAENSLASLKDSWKSTSTTTRQAAYVQMQALDGVTTSMQSAVSSAQKWSTSMMRHVDNVISVFSKLTFIVSMVTMVGVAAKSLITYFRQVANGYKRITEAQSEWQKSNELYSMSIDKAIEDTRRLKKELTEMYRIMANRVTNKAVEDSAEGAEEALSVFQKLESEIQKGNDLPSFAEVTAGLSDTWRKDAEFMKSLKKDYEALFSLYGKLIKQRESNNKIQGITEENQTRINELIKEAAQSLKDVNVRNIDVSNVPPQFANLSEEIEKSTDNTEAFDAAMEKFQKNTSNFTDIAISDVSALENELQNAGLTGVKSISELIDVLGGLVNQANNANAALARLSDTTVTLGGKEIAFDAFSDKLAVEEEAAATHEAMLEKIIEERILARQKETGYALESKEIAKIRNEIERRNIPVLNRLVSLYRAQLATYDEALEKGNLTKEQEKERYKLLTNIYNANSEIAKIRNAQYDAAEEQAKIAQREDLLSKTRELYEIEKLRLELQYTKGGRDRTDSVEYKREELRLIEKQIEKLRSLNVEEDKQRALIRERLRLQRAAQGIEIELRTDKIDSQIEDLEDTWDDLDSEFGELKTILTVGEREEYLAQLSSVWEQAAALAESTGSEAAKNLASKFKDELEGMGKDIDLDLKMARFNFGQTMAQEDFVSNAMSQYMQGGSATDVMSGALNQMTSTIAGKLDALREEVKKGQISADEYDQKKTMLLSQMDSSMNELTEQMMNNPELSAMMAAPTQATVSKFDQFSKEVLDKIKSQWERALAEGDTEMAELYQKAYNTAKGMMEKFKDGLQQAAEEFENFLKNKWDEGFSLGWEYGTTLDPERKMEIMEQLKMQLAQFVSKQISNVIRDAFVDFFSKSMDFSGLTKGLQDMFGKTLGSSISKGVANIFGGLLSQLLGFFVGQLFGNLFAPLQQMAESQEKNQRDRLMASGYQWSYRDAEKATPYYEFQPPISQESVKIVKFATNFNITTDAAAAMINQRRELERVVEEILERWTRNVSKTVGARV